MSYFSTGAELLAAIAELGESKVGSYIPFDAGFYATQYGDKNDYDGTKSALDNFMATGANKLYKPNAQFDPVYYANANADLKAMVNSGELNAADLLVHYLKFGLDEGRVATQELADGFDADAYLAANPDVKAAVEAAAADGAFGGSVTNGAIAHYVKFGMAEGRPGGLDDGEEPTTGTELDIGRDSLMGTAGNDTFYAPILDNKNTFETGDSVNGGAGFDTLEVDLGDSQDFAILARLTDVEAVKFTVQTTDFDDSDNNINDGAQIDAQRSVGVTHWESNNSRADLKIEDVRIRDNEITKDITIAFVESDPGNVDYAVYFDQDSLRKEGSSSTTQLTVSISNPLEVSKGFDPANPLEDVPYDQLRFELDGEEKTVTLDLTDVTTYDDLYAALQAAFAAAAEGDASLAGITIQRIPNGESFFSRDGQPRTADQFVLSAQDAELTRATVGWNASGGLPSDNAFSAIVTQGAPITESFLITSTVILDHVGRSSMGGDLLIGGQSVGTTSTSRGVEQFDITVERSSKLQQIASTNDTLQVVTISSGDQYREWVNGTRTDLKYGDLTVTGDVEENPFAFASGKPALDLVGDDDAANDQNIDGLYGDHNGFGFTNIREIDASGFLGKTNLNVVLDERVTAKYMNLFDTDANPAADNVEFQYSLGTNDDDFFIAISDDNLASMGTTTREDFDLLIEGGAGNDTIDALVYGEDLEDGNLASGGDGLAHWYLNSALNANLAIDAGSGNDTVSTHGSGDWFVDLGDGNDTHYADNSGDKTVWVLNAVHGDDFDLDVNNIQSDNNDTYAIYKGQLTVSLTREDGSVYTTRIVTVPSTTNVTSDLQVNQAIKDAINGDPVLSKLLKASDGPGNSLVVRSLIDEQSDDEVSGLSIDIAAPLASNLSAAEISAYALKHGLGVGATAAQVVAAINTAIGNWDANLDYVPATDNGTEGGTEELGNQSVHTADNTIMGGRGNDVLVLGTGAESNDTVRYEGSALNVDAANGYDTIVNFNEEVNDVVTETIIVGSEDTFENFVVSFADLDLTDTDVETLLDITLGDLEINDIQIGTGTDSLIPGEDVAYEVYEALLALPEFDTAGGLGVEWVLEYDGLSNQIKFTHTTAGDIDNITAADFEFDANVENVANPVTITDYVNGSEAYDPGAAASFQVNFNGSVVEADGEFTFDGVEIDYDIGDGPIELAAKVAAGDYDNWTVVNDGFGVVTFTAKAVGENDDVNDLTGEDFGQVATDPGAAEVVTMAITAEPTADGTLTFSGGVTVAVLNTDTLADVATKVAAAFDLDPQLVGWTEGVAGSTITFTAPAVGTFNHTTEFVLTDAGGTGVTVLSAETTPGEAATVSNGLVANVFGQDDGEDATGELLGTTTYERVSGAGDYLDFSSYNPDGVVVNGGIVSGSNGAVDTYIRMTENTAAFPGEGVYLIEVVNADGIASTNDVQIIGVADFGRHVDFVADNFILA